MSLMAQNSSNSGTLRNLVDLLTANPGQINVSNHTQSDRQLEPQHSSQQEYIDIYNLNRPVTRQYLVEIQNSHPAHQNNTTETQQLNEYEIPSPHTNRTYENTNSTDQHSELNLSDSNTTHSTNHQVIHPQKMEGTPPTHIVIQQPVEIGKFHGKSDEDISEFLDNFDKCSEVNQWDENHKIKRLQFHLEGTARHAYHNIVSQTQASQLTWQYIVQQLGTVFGTQENKIKYKTLLYTRRQGIHEPAEIHVQEILYLVSKVKPDMSEEDIMEILWDSLLPSVIDKLGVMDNSNLASMRANIKLVEEGRFRYNQNLKKIQQQTKIMAEYEQKREINLLTEQPQSTKTHLARTHTKSKYRNGNHQPAQNRCYPQWQQFYASTMPQQNQHTNNPTFFNVPPFPYTNMMVPYMINPFQHNTNTESHTQQNKSKNLFHRM